MSEPTYEYNETKSEERNIADALFAIANELAQLRSDLNDSNFEPTRAIWELGASVDQIFGHFVQQSEKQRARRLG